MDKSVFFHFVPLSDSRPVKLISQAQKAEQHREGADRSRDPNERLNRCGTRLHRTTRRTAGRECCDPGCHLSPHPRSALCCPDRTGSPLRPAFGEPLPQSYRWSTLTHQTFVCQNKPDYDKLMQLNNTRYEGRIMSDGRRINGGLAQLHLATARATKENTEPRPLCSPERVGLSRIRLRCSHAHKYYRCTSSVSMGVRAILSRPSQS